jgi:pyruvate/2-oxoglutarate dehydrogenase complex dihydrolipoamide dehydrogenase (E3) component
MEAARVAALRGHKVTLVEAEPDLGGTVKLAAMAPSRATIRDIAVWQQDEVYRLGVDVRTGTYMDVDDILAEGADKVILATGSMPRLDGIQLSNPGEPIEGINHPNVISSNDLFLERDTGTRKAAVVIDDSGHYEAVACADLLVSRGVDVTFVTRHHAFAPLIESALMTEPALRRLSQGRFTLHTRMRALSVDGEGVVIAPTFLPKDSNHRSKVPADTIVFVSRNRPNRDMYDALKDAGVDVTLVGDANAPRFMPVAMREGNLAGAAA